MGRSAAEPAARKRAKAMKTKKEQNSPKNKTAMKAKKPRQRQPECKRCTCRRCRFYRQSVDGFSEILEWIDGRIRRIESPLDTVSDTHRQQSCARTSSTLSALMAANAANRRRACRRRIQNAPHRRTICTTSVAELTMSNASRQQSCSTPSDWGASVLELDSAIDQHMQQRQERN